MQIIYPVLQLLLQPTKFAWFSPEIFAEGLLQSQAESSEEPNTDQGTVLALVTTLVNINKQILKMLIGTGSIHLPSLKPLQQNTEDLRRLECMLYQVDVTEDEFAVIFAGMKEVRVRLVDAETLLVKQEILSLADGKMLTYTASLWERVRYRVITRGFPAHLPFKWPESVSLPLIEHHEHRDEQICGICCEEIEGPDKSIAVTHKCCFKPLDVSCLLSWLFTQCVTGQWSCSYCRTELDSDFLANVMLMAIRELDVL
jgi:hypothetical protein